LATIFKVSIAFEAILLFGRCLKWPGGTPVTVSIAFEAILLFGLLSLCCRLFLGSF